jgi:hypothetical protein
MINNGLFIFNAIHAGNLRLYEGWKMSEEERKEKSKAHSIILFIAFVIGIVMLLIISLI